MRPLTAGLTSAALTATLLTSAAAPGRASSPEPSPTPRVAPTAVTVGSIAGVPATVCNNQTLANLQAGAGQPSYVVPTDGVITSWSTRANGNPNTAVRMVLFGIPTGSSYPIAAKGVTRALLPSTVNTFDVRIPVQAGWRLGARFVGANVGCIAPGTASDTIGLDVANSDLDAVSSVTLTPAAAGLLDIAAVLEPDADRDGFGDVSQDGCPVSALAQAACPDPQTTITKAPRHRTGKRKVRLAFTSSVPGSTFLVTVDRKRPVPSLSPFVQTLAYGKHTITVQAVSPLGPVDPTPETVSFKIKKKKRH